MDVFQGEEVWQICQSAAGSHCTAAKVCWGYRPVRARHAPTSLPPMGFHKICLNCLFYLHEGSELVLICLAVSPGQPGRVRQDMYSFGDHDRLTPKSGNLH